MVSKRFILRGVFCVLLAFITLIKTNSQECSSDSLMVERFFNLYEGESVSAAMDYLNSSNPWIAMNSSGSEKLEELVSDFGKFYGFEYIKKGCINNRYSIISCMVIYERQPLRFSFILYKPKDEWRFQSFRFDNDLESEMINSTVVSWDF